MNIKKIDDFNKLNLNDGDIILVDEYKDEEYLKSLNLPTINLNNIHENIDNQIFISELEKLIFISKFTEELNETTIEIGNFITEIDLYNIEDKELEKYQNYNKNLFKIKQIHNEYKKYKKENNLYDMADGLKKSLKLDLFINNLYIYNILFLDKRREELLYHVISQSNKSYILKEKETLFSYFELKLKNQKNQKKNYNAKYIKLENKFSILNFLNKYEEEDIGVILFNGYENLFPLFNLSEFNFVLSSIKSFYKTNDIYDNDNISKYLNKEEINKLLNDNKNIIHFLNRLYGKFNFLILEKLLSYQKIIEKTPIEEQEKIIENIISIYIKKNKDKKNIKLLNKNIEVVPISKIKTKKIVFVLNSELNQEKSSFLADIHRKELNLVHSEQYIELQKQYKEKIASFNNVVFVDYKYTIEGLNEGLLHFKLENFENPLKIKIDKSIKYFDKLTNMDFIKDIDKLNINDLHLIETEILSLRNKQLNLTYNYLNKLDEEDLNNIKREMVSKVLDYPDSKLKSFKDIHNFLSKEYKKINKIQQELLLVSKKISKLNSNVEFNKLLSNQKFVFKKKISEFNKEIDIIITIDKIDFIDEKEINIYFYSQEPFTWQNKYHKTKMLNELFKNNGYTINEIIYLGII